MAELPPAIEELLKQEEEVHLAKGWAPDLVASYMRARRTWYERQMRESAAPTDDMQDRYREWYAQVPQRYWPARKEARVQDRYTTEAMQKAVSWAVEAVEHIEETTLDGIPYIARLRGKSLTLLGPTGVGKTWAAAAAAWMLVGQGVIMRWRHARDAALEVMAERRGSPLMSVSLLVIDDLGAEENGDKLRAALEELISYRHADERATIITSNLAPDGIISRYGARMLDRLREWGPIVELHGKSMRRDRRA